MKKIGNWLSNILFAFVIIISIGYISSSIQLRQNPGQIPSTFGFIPLTVLSGSMSPAIEAGDMIVIKSSNDNLKMNDVITYRMGKTLVTHRIIEISNVNGEEMYKTQGDANNVDDGNLIAKEQVVGRYMFRLPFAGYAISYLSGWLGVVLILVVMMAFLVSIVLKESKTQLNKAKGSN